MDFVMVLMERRCVHCDREMPVDATFCPYCGTQQAPSKPEREERRPEPILHQVSESLVWDSHIIEAARRLTGRSPLAVDSHEFGPADLRNLAHVSRFLEDHSMAAAASGPNVTPVVLAPRTMLVENYVIEDTLGMGGMGMVYKARDMAMHRRVAVKVLHANLFRKERSRLRFMREAKLMAALYHPNILRIHDLLEQEEWMAIVMQLVQGKSLREFLDVNTCDVLCSQRGRRSSRYQARQHPASRRRARCYSFRGRLWSRQGARRDELYRQRNVVGDLSLHGTRAVPESQEG